MKRINSTVQVESTRVGECLRDRQGCAVSGGKCPDGRTPCVAENKGVRTSGYAESAFTHGMKYRTPIEWTQKISSPLRDCQASAGLKEDGKYDMPVQVMDCIDVAARAGELGCRVPVGIALLPTNFLTARNAAELCYHEAVPSVRAAWRSVGLIDVGLDRKSRQSPSKGRASADQPVHLTVFFGAGLLRGGAGLVTLALGMVAAVLTERPGTGVDLKNIRFDAIVERPGRSGYTCLEFHGDAYELVALARPVREVWTAGRVVNDE